MVILLSKTVAKLNHETPKSRFFASLRMTFGKLISLGWQAWNDIPRAFSSLSGQKKECALLMASNA
jgi:hypothetical protein